MKTRSLSQKSKASQGKAKARQEQTNPEVALPPHRSPLDKTNANVMSLRAREVMLVLADLVCQHFEERDPPPHPAFVTLAPPRVLGRLLIIHSVCGRRTWENGMGERGG